ncbi:MAG TPA: hypothetical protein VF494_05390 [Candidatus Limnocylindrales bacterium]
MTDDRFEGFLRAALVGQAPANVPAALEGRVLAIPVEARPSLARLTGPMLRPLPVIGFAVTLLVVLVAVAALVTSRPDASVGTAGSNPVHLSSTFATFSASDFTLLVDGRRVPIPSPGDAGVQTFSFTGSSTYGALTIAWRSAGEPYVVVVHLAADAQAWWISDALATDGRTEQAGYLYFEGPALETPRGGAFAGQAMLRSVRSTYGERGALRFGELNLAAFLGKIARDPSLGTMAPDGGVSPGAADYIPMVSGETIVGYVASPTLLDSIPMNSFRALAPDIPVFGRDLRTIVGYSVPDHGFQSGG